MDFDLTSNENLYLIPPYLEKDKEFYIGEWEKLHLQNHIFIFSSGTTSLQKKSYAISKEAMFNNAKAVNEFLQATKDDIWLNILPPFHVGGLSIYFRSSLVSSKVIQSQEKWTVLNFLNLIKENNVNYTSIVPQQAYEIMLANKVAPSCLKGVFVGGDYLPEPVAKKIFELGWPIIKTYGMTELSSQIASSYYNPSNDEYLEVLSNHKIVDNKIYSNSIFSATIIFDDDVYISRAQSDFFELPDNIKLKNIDSKQFLFPLGRNDGGVKIKGRLYFLNDLKSIFHNIFIELSIYTKAEVFISQEKTIVILLPLEFKVKEQDIVTAVDLNAKPLMDLLEFRYLEHLLKTPLGKIKKIF